MEGISSPLALHQSPGNQGAAQGAVRQARIQHGGRGPGQAIGLPAQTLEQWWHDPGPRPAPASSGAIRTGEP
ncbi:hypothetical protein BS78_06G266300 [Paspalum vaginatum]|nr:hypothetical protein BS78_06G266300 [Paspalum vaginatum]